MVLLRIVVLNRNGIVDESLLVDILVYYQLFNFNLTIKIII